MGFLDNVRDALKGAVSTKASKDDVVEEAREDAPETRQEAPAPSFETYTVKVGDTLSEIGARFGVSYQEIARLNNIDNPDLIFPGQVFRIPKG